MKNYNEIVKLIREARNTLNSKPTGAASVATREENEMERAKREATEKRLAELEAEEAKRMAAEKRLAILEAEKSKSEREAAQKEKEMADKRAEDMRRASEAEAEAKRKEEALERQVNELKDSAMKKQIDEDTKAAVQAALDAERAKNDAEKKKLEDGVQSALAEQKAKDDQIATLMLEKAKREEREKVHCCMGTQCFLHTHTLHLHPPHNM